MATCRRAPARSPARATKPAPNELARMGAFAGAFGPSPLSLRPAPLWSPRRRLPTARRGGPANSDQRLQVAGVPAEPQGVLARAGQLSDGRRRQNAGARGLAECEGHCSERPRASQLPLDCFAAKSDTRRQEKSRLPGPSRRRRALGERRPPLGVRFRLGRLPDLAVRGSRRERVGWRQAALCRVGGVTHLA